MASLSAQRRPHACTCRARAFMRLTSTLASFILARPELMADASSRVADSLRVYSSRKPDRKAR